jgi:hypothetical protein
MIFVFDLYRHYSKQMPALPDCAIKMLRTLILPEVVVKHRHLAIYVGFIFFNCHLSIRKQRKKMLTDE